MNVGGQLIKATSIKKLVSDIHRNKIQSWEQVHGFYISEAKAYAEDKLLHSLSVWQAVFGGTAKLKEEQLRKMFADALITRTWMNEGIKASREKDYENPFRQMVYESEAEMNKVLGPLSENSFILQENQKFKEMKTRINSLLKVDPSGKSPTTNNKSQIPSAIGAKRQASKKSKIRIPG
jgi:hypothetical protein